VLITLNYEFSQTQVGNFTKERVPQRNLESKREKAIPKRLMCFWLLLLPLICLCFGFAYSAKCSKLLPPQHFCLVGWCHPPKTTHNPPINHHHPLPSLFGSNSSGVCGLHFCLMLIRLGLFSSLGLFVLGRNYMCEVLAQAQDSQLYSCKFE